jgi:hypothetical protein
MDFSADNKRELGEPKQDKKRSRKTKKQIEKELLQEYMIKNERSKKKKHLQ